MDSIFQMAWIVFLAQCTKNGVSVMYVGQWNPALALSIMIHLWSVQSRGHRVGICTQDFHNIKISTTEQILCKSCVQIYYIDKFARLLAQRDSLQYRQKNESD